MKILLFHTILLALLLGWTSNPAWSAAGPLALGIDTRSAAAAGKMMVRSGSDGSVFVLDRPAAVLYRIDPADGSVLWKIDGSESGDEFIDPAWISRPDGFYIYLTDRGTRRVWRIDYRGELRGAVDLSFATDPVLLELAAGGQMLVYDRAAGLVYLLDDSGRRLWSFPPGEGRTSAEPAGITVGAAGQQVYLLWQDSPHLTVVSLSGRSTRRVEIGSGLPGEVAAAAAAGIGESAVLGIVTTSGRMFRLDPWTGMLERIEPAAGSPLAVCGDRDGFTVLTGPEPALWRLELEGGR